jgi:hypothetical protein
MRFTGNGLKGLGGRNGGWMWIWVEDKGRMRMDGKWRRITDGGEVICRVYDAREGNLDWMNGGGRRVWLKKSGNIGKLMVVGRQNR